ncbi:class I SAM-dependent methyltransferase [Spirosoma agri]|uniref:Class I SAM-dependent methyltransferase n=1 Tax=Spirosoma agri TaxID=1987381 RepID=A0A6M0IIK6_9BACT|nr:class I SAM-dependent methyltransferase [Spirosoma agri]NEU68110.1 class I SAM-dependent methyltransferase [Spirosoma agri]
MSEITDSSAGFDWVAPVYDRIASLVFGRKLQQAQVVFLDAIPANASVLLVGGGTGWLLEQLLIQRKPRRVLYLEASARMVALSSQRMIETETLGSVEFRVSSDITRPINEQFDVVITPFLLDLFPEVKLRDSLIPQLRNALDPTGIWLVTDFIRTDVWWQKALLWSMIQFFRLTAGIETKRLANWQARLIEAGLSCQNRQARVAGMVSTEVWTIQP